MPAPDDRCLPPTPNPYKRFGIRNITIHSFGDTLVFGEQASILFDLSKKPTLDWFGGKLFQTSASQGSPQSSRLSLREFVEVCQRRGFRRKSHPRRKSKKRRRKHRTAATMVLFLSFQLQIINGDSSPL